MKFRLKYIALLLLIGFVLGESLVHGAFAAETAPKKLSHMALLDMVKLNKGKVVVLNFFATWCPPCKEEIPGLIAISKEYPADKLVIIGISVDQDPSKVPAFIEQLKINFPVFLAGEDIPPVFGIRSIPHNVIYDTEGELAASAAGFVEEVELKGFINTLLEKKKK